MKIHNRENRENAFGRYSICILTVTGKSAHPSPPCRKPRHTRLFAVRDRFSASRTYPSPLRVCGAKSFWELAASCTLSRAIPLSVKYLAQVEFSFGLSRMRFAGGVGRELRRSAARHRDAGVAGGMRPASTSVANRERSQAPSSSFEPYSRISFAKHRRDCRRHVRLAGR
jgi:hypothetical protein